MKQLEQAETRQLKYWSPSKHYYSRHGPPVLRDDGVEARHIRQRYDKFCRRLRQSSERTGFCIHSLNAGIRPVVLQVHARTQPNDVHLNVFGDRCHAGSKMTRVHGL